MQVKIREMTKNDIDDWVALSRQYDKYILELVGNLDEWYNGNDVDVSFLEYINAKISKSEAFIACISTAIVGAIAFSKTHNRITFFAVSHQTDFEKIGKLLIKNTLEKLDLIKPITINIIKSSSDIIEKERCLMKEYGFLNVAESIENGVPVDVFRRL